MKQTFDLNKMGLTLMGDLEMEEIDGGFLGWDDLALLAAGLLITAVYDMGKAYGAKLAHQ